MKKIAHNIRGTRMSLDLAIISVINQKTMKKLLHNSEKMYFPSRT